MTYRKVLLSGCREFACRGTAWGQGLGRSSDTIVSTRGRSCRYVQSTIPVVGDREQRRLAEREAAITKREGELVEANDRMRRRGEQLQDREREVEVREWRLELAKELPSQPSATRAKTGRNERCPCGSGLKYKQCHGSHGGSGLRPT